MARKKCKYGKLKHPRGRRICRARPVRRKKAASRKRKPVYGPKKPTPAQKRQALVAAERASEQAYIAKLKSGLGRFRR